MVKVECNVIYGCTFPSGTKSKYELYNRTLKKLFPDAFIDYRVRNQGLQITRLLKSRVLDRVSSNFFGYPSTRHSSSFLQNQSFFRVDLNTSLNKNFDIRIYFIKLIIFLNDVHRTVSVRHPLLKIKNLISKLRKIVFQCLFIRKKLAKIMTKSSKISINYSSLSIG